MGPDRRIHRSSTRVFSVLMALVGVVMVVSTVARGGGPLALGVILGLLFVAAGIGRFYVTTRT